MPIERTPCSAEAATKRKGAMGHAPWATAAAARAGATRRRKVMGHQQRSLTLSYTAQSSVMLAARAGLTAAASGVKAAARVALRGAWTGVAALQHC